MLLSKLLSVLLAMVSLRGSLCLNMGQDALLLGAGGEPVTPPGVYQQVYAIGSTPYFALCEKQSGLYRICDGQGNMQSEETCEAVRACGEGVIVKKNGLWAYCDQSLAPLTDYAYSAIYAAGENCYAFRTSLADDRADELYILDRDGRERASGWMLAYGDLKYADGRCACVDQETGLYFYIDGEGARVSEESFLWAGDYVSGLAAVRTDSGLGVIDTDGSRILSPVYERLILTEHFILCREAGVRGAVQIYARTDDGLIQFASVPYGDAAAVGKYIAIYGERYAFALGAEGTVRAVFTPDTLLYEGVGTQLIARDQNGAYVYDVANARMRSAFFSDVRRLRNTDAYLCARADEDGTLRFGVLSAEGEMLLETDYEYISAPGADIAAALRGSTVYLYSLTGDEPFCFKKIEIGK